MAGKEGIRQFRRQRPFTNGKKQATTYTMSEELVSNHESKKVFQNM